MKAELDLILRETARLARDSGFIRTAEMVDLVLVDLREAGAKPHPVPPVLH